MIGNCTGSPSYQCAVSYIQADSCLISGVCYANYQLNPYNPCQICNNTLPFGTPSSYLTTVPAPTPATPTQYNMNVYLQASINGIVGHTPVSGWNGTGVPGYYSTSQMNGTYYTVAVAGYYFNAVVLNVGGLVGSSPCTLYYVPIFVVNGIQITSDDDTNSFQENAPTISMTLRLNPGDYLNVATQFTLPSQCILEGLLRILRPIYGIQIRGGQSHCLSK